MANTLGVYDPIFFAQEALIHLENALGMATRVHRSFGTLRASSLRALLEFSTGIPKGEWTR